MKKWKHCKICGSLFKGYRNTDKYCSSSCAKKAMDEKESIRKKSLKKCMRHKCQHYKYSPATGYYQPVGYWYCDWENILPKKKHHFQLCIREATGDYYKPKVKK